MILNPSILYCFLKPLLWHHLSAVSFIVSIHTSPDRRWWLLPFNLIPLAQVLLSIDDLRPILPGLDWLWAFTTAISVFHIISVLYIERLTLSELSSTPTAGWNVALACKTWRNPRRILYPQWTNETSPQSRRALFVLRRLGVCAAFWLIYALFEVSIIYVLTPGPSDFSLDKRTFFHWKLDRTTAIRAAYSFSFARQTYGALTTIHTIVSIFYVGILQLDTPQEWPPLYGSLLDAHTLQCFWGRWCHKLGSPSQKSYGRFIFRLLNLKPEGRAAKMFLALWVFTISGLIHTLVAWKNEPEMELFNEVFFLWFSFAGGLVEYYFQCSVQWVTQSSRRHAGWAEKLVGFCWVFVFFYCVSPPYQYSHVYADMLRRDGILGRASGIKITVDI